MIGIFIFAVIVSSLVYFSLKRMSIWIKTSISILIFITILSYAFYLFSKIDTPPEGSRAITQEELDNATGLSNKELEEYRD